MRETGGCPHQARRCFPHGSDSNSRTETIIWPWWHAATMQLVVVPWRRVVQSRKQSVTVVCTSVNLAIAAENIPRLVLTSVNRFCTANIPPRTVVMVNRRTARHDRLNSPRTTRCVGVSPAAVLFVMPSVVFASPARAACAQSASLAAVS